MSNKSRLGKLPKILASNIVSKLELNQRQELVRIISNRLFIILLVFLVLLFGWCIFVSVGEVQKVGALPAVIFAGVVGGLIGLQNRLKTLDRGDLLLLSKSSSYLMLAPLVGGFLAILVYILFISSLLEGELFPKFVKDGDTDTSISGIGSIFMIHAENYQAYGKLIFWSFIAGFSERFVTNIIGHFEATAAQNTNQEIDALDTSLIDSDTTEDNDR